METNDPQATSTAAQEQLETFAESSRAAQLASLETWPRWFYPGVAFVGPAAIWLFTAFGDMPEVGATEQRILAIGGIAMMILAIAAGILATRWHFAHTRVYPKVPGSGAPSSKWAVLSNIVPPAVFIAVTQLVITFDIYAPYVIGGLLYIALATLPPYLWRRNVKTIAARLQ